MLLAVTLAIIKTIRSSETIDVAKHRHQAHGNRQTGNDVDVFLVFYAVNILLLQVIPVLLGHLSFFARVT